MTHLTLMYLFLPFSLPPFEVNGQTSLIVVLLCDLLYSYVLLIDLTHRLFWFSMYHLHLLQDQRSFFTLSFQIPLTCFYSSFQNPNFIDICYCWSYDTPVQFQYWLLREKYTFKEKLFCIICFISKCYSILDLFFYWVTNIYSGSQIFIGVDLL